DAQLLDLLGGRQVDRRRGRGRLLAGIAPQAAQRLVAPEPRLRRRGLQLERGLERLKRPLAVRDVLVEAGKRALGLEALEVIDAPEAELRGGGGLFALRGALERGDRRARALLPPEPLGRAQNARLRERRRGDERQRGR